MKLKLDENGHVGGIWIGGIVSVAMMLARLKKQPELHGGDNEKTD